MPPRRVFEPRRRHFLWGQNTTHTNEETIPVVTDTIRNELKDRGMEELVVEVTGSKPPTVGPCVASHNVQVRLSPYNAAISNPATSTPS